MKRLFAIVLAVLAFSYAQVVWAQALPVPRVVFPMTITGNTINLGPLTANASNAAKFSFGAAANGAIFANTGALLPTAGGNSVPIAVGGTVAKASALAAIGRFAVKALPLLNTASALYELGGDLGYVARPLQGDNVELLKIKKDISCEITPYVQTNASNTCKGNGFVSGIAEASPTGNGYCSLTYVCTKSNGDTYDIYAGSVAQKENTSEIPLTSELLVNDLDSSLTSGGLTSERASKLARVIKDALSSGEAVQVQPSSVTGPQSQQVGQTVTNNATNGQTTTNTTTQNYSYGPSSVTVTTTNNITVTNTTTGEVLGSQTTTDASTQPNNGGTEPEQPKDPCEGHPERLGCMEIDSPSGEIPKVNKQITFTAQNPFGGGSCPADKYQTLHTGQSLKVVDWATPCGYIADYVRPVLILLGAWAAMMLLIPGRTES